MRELVVEVVLRLTKIGAATVIGVLVYLVAVGPLGVPGTLDLALLSWLCGAAAVLLVESSPL